MNPPFSPVLIFLALACPLHVFAFGNGKVIPACFTMEPQHGTTAQTSPAPYNITISQETYKAGDRIIVTISSNTNSTLFAGFLLQAREASNGNTPVGSFLISNSDMQALNCSKTFDAVSHTSNKKKTSIQVTWIAPTDITSDILMKATVVAEKPTYWTNVQGPRLSFSGGSISGGSSRPNIMSPVIYCGLFMLTALLK
ncbi:putative defense protein 3 [Microcaecilia unicolor]|uniref:Defense protein 3 n=1 Tax=Microcaecilia unicolor TaxID=1415580 RepID=A0A6P7Y4F4_9AMPH|nr:putative defense protein 3 [Microcaecilia unicolor]